MSGCKGLLAGAYRNITGERKSIHCTDAAFVEVIQLIARIARYPKGALVTDCACWLSVSALLAYRRALKKIRLSRLLL